MGDILIGTSGFSFDDWAGEVCFYSEKELRSFVGPVRDVAKAAEKTFVFSITVMPAKRSEMQT